MLTFFKLTKKISFLISLILLSHISISQIPSLTIIEQIGDEVINISSLEVDIKVVGNYSVTTYDILFYNPQDRVLQGELTLPLKEGQEICRYALDVNGKLREGVIIEEIKARQTFEAVVRQQIDPGIVNITKGNMFNTKIYPIPAQGSKRVIIAFSETLSGDDNNLFYSLPINTVEKINNFKLAVQVKNNQSTIHEIKTNYGNITFDDEYNAYCLNFERKDFETNKAIDFSIPRFSKSDYELYTTDFEGETYFYLNLKAPKLNSKNKKAPQKIAIYWDNSFSADSRDIGLELDLLNEYLSTTKGIKEISLITFNNTVKETITFSAKTDRQRLLDYIKRLKNDGATCFDEIEFTTECNEILIFSDATYTIGTDNISIPKIPIYTITSSVGSNYSLLKKLAIKSNGEFINLNSLPIHKALQLLKKDSEKYLGYHHVDTDFDEVYPNSPKAVNGYIEIVGKLKTDKSNLIIDFGDKSGITQFKQIEIIKNNKADISRIWASKKIEALETQYSERAEEVYKIGQKFNILTENASFIVLDRVEDYVEHAIIPPYELLERYNELISEQNKEVIPVISNELIFMNRLKAWYLNPIPTKDYEANQGVSRQMSGAIDSINVQNLSFSYSIQDSNFSVIEEEEVHIVRGSRSEANIVAIDDMELVEDELMMHDEAAYSGYFSPEYGTPNNSIQVLAWLPDAQYMQDLRNAKEEDIELLYYKFKSENKNRPSFYIQVADFLYEKGMKEIANRIITNILELDLENPELLKITSRYLVNEGDSETAIKILHDVKDLRPEEPQSYRDLALAYTANGEFQMALKQYEYILQNKWERFNNIKPIVLNEYNSLITMHKSELNISDSDTSYIFPMPLDVRITIDWSSNDTDIDLWVIDPENEKCFYGNNRSKMGGKMSSDFTQGYGPEEFSIKTAKPGKYMVYVNYFGHNRQTIAGPVTVYATLTTNYATPQEKTKKITIQLNDNKETKQIGVLEFVK